jgi:8-oxo-dGTP diphosphatase
MPYRNPYPTVDVIVEIAAPPGGPGPGIVLVQRRNPPLGWAIPGGFVDEGERVEDAAVREVREETGLRVHLSDLLYVYSDPARDPRHHTLSVVFIGQAVGNPTGGDDAEDARVFPLDDLPSPIVFDHARIVADYRHFRETGERPRPVASLLP